MRKMHSFFCELMLQKIEVTYIINSSWQIKK